MNIRFIPKSNFMREVTRETLDLASPSALQVDHLICFPCSQVTSTGAAGIIYGGLEDDYLKRRI